MRKITLPAILVHRRHFPSRKTYI